VAVGLHVLNAHTRHHFDATPGFAAIFQSEEDFVLDCHVPRIVVLAGLDHGTRSDTASPPPFISIVSKSAGWDMISRLPLAF